MAFYDEVTNIVNDTRVTYEIGKEEQYGDLVT